MPWLHKDKVSCDELQGCNHHDSVRITKEMVRWSLCETQDEEYFNLSIVEGLHGFALMRPRSEQWRGTTKFNQLTKACFACLLLSLSDFLKMPSFYIVTSAVGSLGLAFLLLRLRARRRKLSRQVALLREQNTVLKQRNKHSDEVKKSHCESLNSGVKIESRTQLNLARGQPAGAFL